MSRKSVQWEPRCSMRANIPTDRWTDTTKLIDAFRNFANAPKNKVEIYGLTVVAPHHKIQSTHFHRKICRKTSTQKSAFGSTIEPAISEVQIQVLVKSNARAEGHGCLLLLLLLLLLYY
jgi:hypothetical protein